MREEDISSSNLVSNYSKMSTSTLYLDVVPSVMKWLRESLGFDIHEVSQATGLSLDTIARWEDGSKKPTVDDILKLAEIYKRPVSAFYLPYPMEEPATPVDYRRFRQKDNKIIPNDRYLIKKAQYLQETGNELLNELEEKIEPLIINVSMSSDSEKIAQTERDGSSITIRDQKESVSPHDAFNKWRAFIESKNILVFQFSFEGGNIRGFLLKETKPYTIVLNSREDIRARIFTLLHEYGHILLNESKSALCYPEYVPISNQVEDKIERWCDNFSGSFLMPREPFLSDFNNSLTYEKIRWLANKYQVTKLAALTRLFVLNAITWQQYDELREFITNLKPTVQAGGPGETKAQTALREKGRTFCSIVLKSSNRNIISTKDVLDYLDIKLNNFNEIKKDLAGNA
jgi:Zn-dependent peptidase ImmA (M78 family)/transcriptional regulator with XRE-family HTH domain